MNDLSEVAMHARALMNAHGLGRLPFEFDGGKRRIGAMHYTVIAGQHIPKKISLSRHHAAQMTQDEIRDVVLHEIAHALVPQDSHGPLWRAKAREIGADPKPCKAVSSSVEHAWKGYCPNCGHAVKRMHRAPLRVLICMNNTCTNLSELERVLTWQKNGVWVKDRDMPARYYAGLNRVILHDAFTKAG